MTAALAPLSGGQRNVLEPSGLNFKSPDPLTASETESRYLNWPSIGTIVTVPAEVPPPMGMSVPRSQEFPSVIPQPPTPAADDPAQSRDTSQGAAATTSSYHFNVEWLSLDRVSFRQTRSYRNAWSHGREIKISRDGTELDPKKGERLIEQWKTLSLGQASAES